MKHHYPSLLCSPACPPLLPTRSSTCIPPVTGDTDMAMGERFTEETGIKVNLIEEAAMR